MSKVSLRMKNKMLSKVHLDTSGNMVISSVKAASDAASKGISAQPAGPLTEMENTGNPGPPPSQTTALQNEPATGAPAERVAPEVLPERDVQPLRKDLAASPAQLSPELKAAQEAELELATGLAATQLDAKDPLSEAPAPAPNETLDTVTSDKVMK